ncbi:MAG: MFS transporter [Rhodobiaceae bacterium]|nr:MFS transporter [Rhodobiaceae bacterium]
MADQIQNEDAGDDEDLPGLTATTPEERKRAFGILFVCLLSLGMGQSLFFAVLPPIARELGMTEFETTMIFSLSAFLWILTSAFWGSRSDLVGRKPIMLMGLIGFGVSTVGFAAVVMVGMWGWVSLGLMFPLLISVRAIFGIFGSGTMPAAQAYVADRTTRKERASGVASIGAAFGMGTVVGPGFAAALATLHILAPFFAVSVLAFGGAFFIWLLLPERTTPRQKLAEKRKQRQRLKITDPRVLPWLTLGVVLSFGQSITMQLISFYFMSTFQVEGDEAIQLVSVGLMAMAMATLFAQMVLIQRFDLSVQFLLRVGAMVMIVSFALLVVANSYGLFVSALALAGVGFGMLRPGLMAGASLSVSPHDQGAIAGLIGSTAATGHILNPFIAIPLYYYVAPQAPFILAMGLMVVILLTALFHPVVKSIQANVEEDEDADLHPH